MSSQLNGRLVDEAGERGGARREANRRSGMRCMTLMCVDVTSFPRFHFISTTKHNINTLSLRLTSTLDFTRDNRRQEFNSSITHNLTMAQSTSVEFLTFMRYARPSTISRSLIRNTQRPLSVRGFAENMGPSKPL